MATTNQRNNPTGIISYLLQNPSATAQFFLRCVTFVGSTLFLMGGLIIQYQFAYSCYLNSFLAAFFTFTIRFHQRMKENNVSLFSREFINLITTEDSGHYMIFSFFFYNQPPTAIFILPILFYSILYMVKFVQGIIQFLPSSLHNLVNNLTVIVSTKQADMHRFIAYCEIFIFVVLLWKVLTGYIFFLAPIVYYHFLKMRYLSRRNPSVRLSFSELNQAMTSAAANPKCPQFLSILILKVIAFISRLNPTPGMVHNPQNPS